MKANFDISAVTNKTPLSSITFLGKCYNCDKIIDLSDQLSDNVKRKLVETYGSIVRGGLTVCKQVLEMDYCKKCAQANLG